MVKQNDQYVDRNAFLSVPRPRADRRAARCALRVAAGRQPRAQAVFHDWRRAVPRWLRRACHCGGGEHRPALPRNSGLHRGLVSAAAHEREHTHQGRRGHRDALGGFARHWRDGCLHDDGHEYGRVQLHVRQHPLPFAGRRGSLRRAQRGGARAVYTVLSAPVRRYV
ncbi:hypothetical protein SDC9_194598 [bioreactor metagenome]|uniref:Uncharacterized protein n=1 Tax=bioreactor metagenome TaxID=1076179 RepID=A0A645I6W7_9ZZZZ